MSAALLATIPAAAQTAADTGSVPVVMTVSGGISLGAYQGGVHWALTEFIRTAHDDPAFRGRMGQAAETVVPRYHLAAAAGASAGNINSVMTAVEWCRASDITRAPEQSLFWLTWVRTGWEQLFPGEDLSSTTSNEALFDRRYFVGVHANTIDDAMKGTRARPGCRVPIGITITRLQPDTLDVGRAGGVQAVTQRFASVLDVTAGPNTGVAFRHPADTAIWTDSSLGRIVRLPGTGGTDSLTMQTVMQLVTASSAFPVAFSPVQLTYEDPAGCRRRPASNCGRQTFAFSDGGLFDNNPLDLAYGVYEHRRHGADPHPLTRMLYVDVDRFRGELARTRSAVAPAPVADRGIGAILSLLSGALPTGRQYELHALARAFAADSVNGARDAGWIRATNRAYPVIGEHLGYFAAFLGRPFREYDFFVGIYDGLHYAAQDLVCKSDGRERGDDGCTARVLAQLLEGDTLDFGPVAPRVLSALYAQEYGRPLRPAPAQLAGLDAHRALFAEALVRANEPLLRPVSNAPCKGLPLGERLACGNGLGLMLGSFAGERNVMQTARELARDHRCSHGKWATAPDSGCIAEDSFVELLANPEAFLADMMDLLLHQTWRVEDRLGWDIGDGTYAAKNHELWAELVELMYRSATPRDQGMHWDPSSIPDVVTSPIRTVASHLPYYLGANLDAGGVEVGYRPTYYLSGSWAVVAPLMYNYRPRVRADSGSTAEFMSMQHYFSAGGGFLYKPGIMVSGLELSEQLLLSPDGETAHAAAFSLYLLGDKLRIGVRYIWDPSPMLHRGGHWGVTLGVSDFNGLLYWIFRTKGG